MSEHLDTTFATVNSNEDTPTHHGINTPVNIATISSGFEKGDFLVREEKGQRVYFDFFEEAFNYLANKGYARMKDADADDWMEAVNAAHSSVPNGTRYNTGVLLMVLSRPVVARNIYHQPPRISAAAADEDVGKGTNNNNPHGEGGLV
mmetsp:Transcript_9697/g.18207  ORF Transcript_9697/g.18207 Transcript_9697/m.18207 type:complete len:148 (+) Transcript_9697:265-708(+)